MDLREAFRNLFDAIYEYEKAVGYETLIKSGVNRAHVYMSMDRILSDKYGPCPCSAKQ